MRQPLKHGADIVVESATEWIGGRGTTVGGVIVDGGTMNWNNGKHPVMTDPSPGYHGLKFWDTFGPDGILGANATFIGAHARRRFGGISACAKTRLALSTSSSVWKPCLFAWSVTAKNTLALAKYLEAHPQVSWVSTRSQVSPVPQERLEYFRDGNFGAVLTFGIKGGVDAGMKFIDNVKLASHLANVGDAKTLVIHQGVDAFNEQLTPEEQAASGVVRR